MRQILLTGATGFVGRAVRPVLARAGWRIRAMSRHAGEARRRWPELEWIAGDVGDAASIERALAGCDAALYLVHSIGEGPGYEAREVAAAERFARTATMMGVSRMVYLGGVAPSHGSPPSPHLRSRLAVGEALREGGASTVELRASMIIGHGSLSWLVVRDLAARLPVMVLPRWLRSRTQPVAIDDVTIALARALELPVEGSRWFDIPGPDILSGREILDLTAEALGRPPPRILEVPVLTPRLSSLWVRFVTRAEWAVAREVVVGLTGDLLAHDDRYWGLIGHPHRLSFAEAARRALDDERRSTRPAHGPWAIVERALARAT